MTNFTKTEGQEELMGTTIIVKFYSDLPKVDSSKILQECFNIFHSVVARFTRFSNSSELSLLNKHPGEFFEISKEFFELIELGLELNKATDGVFDMTVIDFLEASGYKNPSKINNQKMFKINKQYLQSRPKMNNIRIDQNKYSVKLQPGQRLDLGSIGKGFAIKLTKDYLIKNNIQNFLINAGGDIYAHGLNKDKKWKISLIDTERSLKFGKYIEKCKIEVKNESVACSSSWAKRTKEFHHLINPETGKSLTTKSEKFPNHSVYVKGKDPVLTDAFATILYINPKIDRNILKKYDVEQISC